MFITSALSWPAIAGRAAIALAVAAVSFAAGVHWEKADSLVAVDTQKEETRKVRDELASERQARTEEKAAREAANADQARENQRLTARAFTHSQETIDAHIQQARTTDVAYSALRDELGRMHDAAIAAERAAEDGDDAEPACSAHAGAIARFRAVVDECSERRVEVAGIAARYADQLGSLQRWIRGSCAAGDQVSIEGGRLDR